MKQINKNAYRSFNNQGNMPRKAGLNLFDSLASTDDKFKKFLSKEISQGNAFDFFSTLGKHSAGLDYEKLDSHFSQFNGSYYINEQWTQHRKDDVKLAKFYNIYKNCSDLDLKTFKKLKVSKANAKESESLIRSKIIDDILPIISKIFLDNADDTFYSDKIRVSLSHIKNKGKNMVLGNCYSKGADVNEQKFSQIHLNIQTAYNLDGTIKWSIVNFEDMLEVLIHELVHATDDCKSSHGKAFAKICDKVGLQSATTKNGKPSYTSTKPNDSFKEMYKEVIEIGKDWVFTEWAFNKPVKESKTVNYKCPVCSSRFSITNVASKHGAVNHYCNHNGTDFEDEEMAEMQEVEKKKPIHISKNK
tara:strand:- start:233 stop:1312 length:1080 start_codon:yes stop_codon:yes gene_type:complete